MEETEVNLSYETLYEYLRREREREELQEMPDTFYDDVAEYLQSKKKEAEEKRNSGSLVTEIDRDNKQLQNIKKIFSSLYERREKKITFLALLRVKVGSEMVDSSNLLPQEQEICAKLEEIYKEGRTSLHNMVLSFQKPASGSANAGKPKDEATTRTIRMLQSVPKSVGEELEAYGPFEKEDITTMPAKIADVLIDKGRAEEVNFG